jgi:hypothetical protein
LAVVQRARDLGAYLQAQAQARPVHRDAETVLRDTAIDLGAMRSGNNTRTTEAALH